MTCCVALLFIGARVWFHHSPATDIRPSSHWVTTQHLHQSLYFKGIIQPLNETVLFAPIDAVVEKISAYYGQSVHPGDVVFTLKSRTLEKKYNDAFLDYLNAKDGFHIAQVQFNSIQELWDMGLMSKNDYVSEKSSLNRARLTLLQSTQTLADMRKIMGYQNDLSTLDQAVFNKIQQTFNQPHHLIRIEAPTSGVLLHAPKSSDAKNPLAVTDKVVAGQTLAIIGDITGIHVTVDIPEMGIAKIHMGMPALVTGVALGKERLIGKMVHIDTQASLGPSGPSFSATVEVARLSVKQRASIKIGMSVAVELIDSQEDQLLIPIAAIQPMGEDAVVTVQNQDGSCEQRRVKTGTATANQVVIQQGLKPGERIVYR